MGGEARKRGRQEESENGLRGKEAGRHM